MRKMATSMCRVWISRNIKCFSRGFSFSARRQLLSEAYSCREAWQKRLESPILQKVSLSEFSIQLRERFDKGKPASVIDMDILANKLHEMDLSDVDFVEDLIHRFRRSENGAPVKDSIVHSIVRAYMDLDLTDRLLVLMKDRANYGIFPDSFAANILMDHFIKKDNYAATGGSSDQPLATECRYLRAVASGLSGSEPPQHMLRWFITTEPYGLDAAKVSYEMMLQEDFSNQITFLLSLLAATKHLHNTTLSDLALEPPPEDTGEEDWVKVKVIRHPYYDDHFDIKDERFLLGKTLYILGQHVNDNDLLSNSLKVTGLGLYQKFGKGVLLLDEIAGSGQKAAILEEALNRFDECIENAETRDPDKPEKDFGLRTIDDEIYKLRLTPDGKEELTTEFEETAHKLRWNNQTSDDSLLSMVESLVKYELSQHEAGDIQAQKELFVEWDKERTELVEEQLKLFIQKERKEEIEKQLKELQDKEELLRYFELRDKIILAKKKAPKIQPPKEEEDEDTLKAKRIKRRKYRHHV